MKQITFYISLFFFGYLTVFSQVKNEDILLKNNKIELSGTLSSTKEKTPLIIWVHGSGNIDRNGNQQPMIKANYIQQFRNEIVKNNIAFFSFDKRTSVKKNLPLLKNMVFNDLAEDVKIIVNHFKKDNRFSEIILIGHSQGSLTAMLAMQKADKFISLAGASETLDKVLVAQIGTKAPFLTSVVEQHCKELKETGSIKNVNPMLLTVFAPQNHTFLASWIQYNPSKEIQKINKPTLIINGNKDLQVPKENAETLHKASKQSELVIIENMNHVLKQIEKDKDNMQSYFNADFPISKELINAIVKFVND